LTDGGEFEVYKHEGEKKAKLSFSSYKFMNPDLNQSITKVDKVKENKTKMLRTILDDGVTDIRIVYNYLIIKTKS
jgi:hypothetical protein